MPNAYEDGKSDRSIGSDGVFNFTESLRKREFLGITKGARLVKTMQMIEEETERKSKKAQSIVRKERP